MYKKNYYCQQNPLISVIDFNIFATLWQGIHQWTEQDSTAFADGRGFNS
jgi:hypothetical protein